MLITLVIADRFDRGFAGCSGVDDEFEFFGRLADVTVLVLLDHDDGVLAFGQRRSRGEFPLAVIADHHFADLLAIVFDDDGVTRSADTGEGRGFIIGGTARGDRTLYGADVIGGTADTWCTWPAWDNRCIAVAVVVVVTGQCISGAQQAERAQAQQCRPEPADATASHQAIAETDQFIGTQNLRGGNTLGQERCRMIAFSVGRDVLIVGAVFGHTHELAWVLVEPFDDQLWLIRVGAFSGHVQVVANSLDGQVLGSDRFFTRLGENVLAVFHRFDANRCARLGGAKLHRFGNRFAVHYGDVHCVCVHCNAFIRQVGHRAGVPARPKYPKPAHSKGDTSG
ncbi:hypothetical protein D3C76_322880 [compost metagenome]